MSIQCGKMENLSTMVKGVMVIKKNSEKAVQITLFSDGNLVQIPRLSLLLPLSVNTDIVLNIQSLIGLCVLF